MSVTNGVLPGDVRGNLAEAVYVPNVGVVAAQGGTVTNDGQNQPSAPTVVQQIAPSAVSGTLQSPGNATGNGTALAILGDGSVILTVIQTGFSGTVTFQGSEDGTNYVNIYATQLGTNTIGTGITSTTVTSTTLWEISVSGMQSILCPITRSAGTCTITGHAVPGSYSARVINANIVAGSALMGAVQLADGTTSSQKLAIDSSGRLTLVPNQVMEIGDGTTPTQKMAIDASGRISILAINSALPAGTNLLGQFAPADGQKASYSAAKVGLVPASSATDIFTITGSGTKTIRVTRIEIVATTTSATPAALDVLLLKRSTANSAGTSTGSPTPVPHDSTNAAVSATVLAYTANPTTGNLVGTAIRNQKLMQTLATYTATDFPVVDRVTWEFGNRPSQAVVLRGTGEVLAVNLNGVSATGTASFDIAIEWTEE